jgi:type I restriction enzyme S subunit
MSSGYCLFLNTKNVRQGNFDFSDVAFISRERHTRLSGGTLKRNDIVLTIRGTLGNTAVYSEDVPFEVVRINSAMLIVRPKAGFDPNFIERFLRSNAFKEWVGLNQRGSAQPHLRTVDIETAKLPLVSERQQRRIVAKVDGLLRKSSIARAQLHHVPRLIEKFKLSILSRIFNETEFARWERGKLEDFVTDSLVGLVRSKGEQSSTGTPYIRMNHFDMDGAWNRDDLTFVSVSPDEFRRYELQAGDILFNTRNSFELVGKVAIWPLGMRRHVYNNNLLRLRFAQRLDPHFAALLMISPAFRGYLHTVKSATTSVCAIYQRSLMAAPFAFPSLDEQRDIVRRVRTANGQIDRLASETVRCRTLIDHLDQAVLDGALEGRLVPEDQSEEHANVLLERIVAERQ